MNGTIHCFSYDLLLMHNSNVCWQ